MKRLTLSLALGLSLLTAPIAPARASELRNAMCDICQLSGGYVAACTMCNILIVWEFFGDFGD